ncbi:hypothetical protein IEQ34_024631 [Dendrobium chrysotoxum]|uniref:Uncharacterized protein n=1 Tax=Dendrobium chrysotoxum TaxID=161865 RepID=A0AAV7FRG8_DENCH|nr:hypothetical protein IEQ34_024631 [Dendrobium chrysotoxum]
MSLAEIGPGGRGLALPTQSARYGRLVRSAKLSFSVPGLQPFQCPSSSFACVLHRRSPDVSLIPLLRSGSVFSHIRMTGMNRICWFRIAREFFDSDFSFARFYSSFLSIEPLSLILLVQPSSRTCTINATEIANSIRKEIGKRATIWHQISGGVERAAVISGKTIKKRRLLVKVSTDASRLGSGKRIKMTGTWEHTDGMNEIRTVNIIWS